MIIARDGGVDANDWAEMLMRMYTHWADDRGYDVEVLDRTDNLEAGIQNATLAVRGPMAYGYLKGETGIHRLVRISPFNAEGKRQTSFAAVDVSPEVARQRRDRTQATRTFARTCSAPAAPEVSTSTRRRARSA